VKFDEIAEVPGYPQPTSPHSTAAGRQVPRQGVAQPSTGVADFARHRLPISPDLQHAPTAMLDGVGRDFVDRLHKLLDMLRSRSRLGGMGRHERPQGG
jgi:predicted component of type VI protein secretion system